MAIKNRTKYASVCLGFGAVLALVAMRVDTIVPPVATEPGHVLIDQKALTPTQWRNFLHRKDVQLSVLTWFFATGGATLTLPADFNSSSNTIFCIGAGAGGVTGTNGVSGVVGGNGGVGGGSGAFVSANNYALIGAGGTVNISVGAGDTAFDTTNSFIIAKAASGQTGGSAAASTGPVGSTKTSGSNGGNGAAGSGGCCGGVQGGAAGGGAGAPGINGAGAAGANGAGSDVGGAGGTGDAGHTAAGADGTEFPTTPATGSGGGGGGGRGGDGTLSQSIAAGNGINAGKYGAGGGGGGGKAYQSGGAQTGPAGTGGAASQGLIAASYTSLTPFGGVVPQRIPQGTLNAWLPPQPQPPTVKNLSPPISGPLPQNPPFPGTSVPVAVQVWNIPPPPQPPITGIRTKAPPTTPANPTTVGLGRSQAPWATFLSWDASVESAKSYALPHGHAQRWTPRVITPPISGPLPQNPPKLGPVGALITDNVLPRWIPPQYQPITVRNLNPPISGPAVPSPANLFNLFNQIVASQNLAWCDFDCYTITLFNGLVLRYTTADFDIAFGGNTFSSQGVRIDQGQSKAVAHWKIGLDVDTWTVVFMPRPVDIITGATFPDAIGSVPWIQAAHSGYLDAADVQVDRAWFSPMPTWPITPGGAVPTGTRTVFAGKVAAVDCTDLVVVLTINDYRDLFSITVPLHFYSAQCRHTLFDSQCNADGTMTRGRFLQNGTVAAASSRGNIIAFGGLPNPGGSGTYTLGIVQMTSGRNNGFQRTVSNWDGSNLKLVAPFPFDVFPGDTFNASAGCDLQRTTCIAFGNLINFGGQPYIPAPETLT